MATVEEPGYAEKLPKHLKADEIEKVIRAIDRKTYTGFRDITIIVLLSVISVCVHPSLSV